MSKPGQTVVAAPGLHWPKWLLNKAQYLAKDGQRYRWHNSQLQPVQAAVAPVLVLSRLGYDEQHESFQIGSRSELKKILRQRQTQALCYHLIGELKNGQRTVITITPQAALVSACQQARLVLPVSLLVAASRQPGLHTILLPDGRFYQLNHSQDQYSFASMPASSLVADEGRALQLLGGHSELPRQHWANAQLAGLWQCASQLPLSSWLECLKSRQAAAAGQRWLPFIALSALLGLSYLLLSSWLLSGQLSQRQQQLAQLNADVSTVLAARSELQQAEQLLQALTGYQQQAIPAEAIWTIIALANLHDITLTTTDGDNQLLRLQGNAASATDWLQLLLSSEVVQSADFTAPVRRDSRGREQFAIALQLKALPRAVLNEADAT